MTLRGEASFLRLTDDSGAVIFDTTKKIQTALTRMNGTYAFPVRNAASGWDVAHTVDFDLGAAPAGAVHVNGWGRLQAGADLIASGRSFQLSGTQLLFASAFALATVSGVSQYFTSWRSITAMVAGGRIVLRDQWFSHGAQAGYHPVRTLPAFNMDYDLRISAFLGGI
ncbi:MAG: hypothetical protein P1U84_12230 [Parvibaculaceae bacterium]|nr:hypothetical protein [Parvibaculaceae bacterium]